MDASRKCMGNQQSRNRKARNQPNFRFPGNSYFTIGKASILNLKYSGLKLNLTGISNTIDRFLPENRTEILFVRACKK